MRIFCRAGTGTSLTLLRQGGRYTGREMCDGRHYFKGQLRWTMRKSIGSRLGIEVDHIRVQLEVEVQGGVVEKV